MTKINEHIMREVGRIGFIGAGKAGFTLGKYFAEHGLLISGYASRRLSSAEEAAEFTGSRAFSDENALLARSDTLFLTVPDGQIEDVWDYMRTLPAGLAGKTVCHVSGSLSDSIFSGMEQTGAFCCSVHPLFAISDKYTSHRELSKCVFTIEGKESGKRRALYEMLTACGNETIVLSGGSKALYHAAAVVSSNFVAGLFELSTQMLAECGFSREAAERALLPLLVGSVDNIRRQGAVQALTGPVERNDWKTVQRHLDAFRSTTSNPKRQSSTKDGGLELQPELADAAYRALSGVLLQMAQQRHPDYDYEKMKEILEL